MAIRYMIQKRGNIAHRFLWFFAVCSVFSTVFFLPSSAQASAEWEVALRVEAGGGHNELVIGADATATDGYDLIWEVYALLGGQIEAYLPHPEWGMVHQVFSRDIKARKAPGVTTEWLFDVDSSLNNSNFTIKWDLSRLPKNYAIVLKDETGAQQIDMRLTTSYSFLYTAGVRPFTVAITAVPDVAAPKPPEGLQGSAVQLVTRRGVRDAVQLSWKRNSESDLAGYNVHRSNTQGSGYQKINPSLISSPKHRYTDKKVTKGQTYYYVVTAVNTSGGESGYSNEVRINIR